MGDKIFGDFDNNSDINELAINLRKNNELDEIRQLAKENDISDEQAEKFISGDILYLVDTTDDDSNEDAEETADEEEVNCSDEDNQEQPEANVVENTSDKATHDFTIDDVSVKLRKELTIYKDGDSKYVVEKLIELSKTDQKLLNNIMQPHKSYDKAFVYFYEKSRSVGHKMPHGNMVYLDNDMAVKLSVEYFNRDDAAAEAKKAKEEKERKERQKVEAEKQKKKAAEAPKKNEASSTAKKPTVSEAPAPKVTKVEPVKKPKNNSMDQLSFDFGI